MTIGDLVRVHWGNCDFSGEEGVGWGYAPGVIMGEIQWWKNAPMRVTPCGDINVFVQGAITAYNMGRCEPMAEVNDEGR